MIDVLLVVLAILLCLISLMKAKEYRQTGLSTHGWMAFVFAFLALAFLLRISGVYLWVERAFGPKSLADAVVRTALMAAAFGAQSLIREASIPNSTRSAWRGSRPTALLVCLSALWSSFIIGHRSGDSQFGSFANVAGWPTVYAAAFLLYMAYVATDVMLGCWRYAKPADGSLQLGLRLMAIGCGTTVIYVGFKATAVVLAHSSPISTAVEAGGGRNGCRPRSAADRRGRCPSRRRTTMASCPGLVSPICGPRQALSLVVCPDRRFPRSGARSRDKPHARPTPDP